MTDKITVCGIEFLPSDVLKSCDPTAYRCYCNDFMLEIDIENLSEYQDVISNIESELLANYNKQIVPTENKKNQDEKLDKSKWANPNYNWIKNLP